MLSRVVSAFAAVLLAAFLTHDPMGAALAAESPLRTWRDSTGQFSIEGQLLQRNATHVQLLTPAGKKIAVPIDRLSDSDREYLAGLAAMAPASGGPSTATAPASNGPSATAPESPSSAADPSPPPAPAAPPAPPAAPQLLARDKAAATAAARAALPEGGTALATPADEPPRGVAPDPAANQPALPQGGFGLPPTDAYDHVSPAYLADPSNPVVAVSVGRHVITEPQNARGRIYLGTLPTGPARPVLEVGEAIELLDVLPAADRAVMVSGHDGLWRGGELVLLQGLAAGQPQEVLRRQLPGIDKPGFKPSVTWARLLSSEHVAALVDSKLYVWNLRSAGLLYWLDGLSSTSPPAISPNRRYLAIPRSGGAALLDVVDGRSLGFVRASGTLTPSVVFDPSGSRLALVASNQLFVWDFTRGESLRQATLAEHIGGKLLGWMGPDLLMTASGSLLRTDLEASLWSYSLSNGEAAWAPGGVLFVQKGSKAGVGLLPVPHPAALAAGKQLERGGDAMLLLRPGSKVAVDAEVIAGVDREEVIAAVQQALQSTGWQIVPRAETTIVAQIGQGPEQTLSYQSRTPGQPLESATVTTATIRPFTAELQIRRGGEVLWTRKTQNHVPGMLFLRGGQTLQEAVKQYERPNPEFFAQLTIPPRIPKPEIAWGLGRSSLDGFQWRDQPPLKRVPPAAVGRTGR